MAVKQEQVQTARDAMSATNENNGDSHETGDSQVELLRAVVLCHPGWDRLAAATFVPK
jgi:hypothetical protein